jgi:CheY-like chemotaxis protein/anti-sigma regulatory factor (Ser/Thr protein kinase)
MSQLTRHFPGATKILDRWAGFRMHTVLIVDDVMADRVLAGGLLGKQHDIRVAYAANGCEALEYLEEHKADAVLTDLQMPEMDGLQLVEEIRLRYPDIPTILMTGEGSEDIAAKALQKGASSYVSKRRLAADLQEIVERVLQSASEQQGHALLMGCIRHFDFDLKNSLQLITSQVRYLRQAVQSLGFFDETDCLRIGTALDEAMLNAYYHGNLEVSSKLRESDHNEFHDLARKRTQQMPYRDRRIRVVGQFDDCEVKFVIRDQGPGFNPSTLPDPTSPQYLDRPSGRGLLLMRAFMDDVIYNETGNEVTLIKHRVTASSPVNARQEHSRSC